MEVTFTNLVNVKLLLHVKFLHSSLKELEIADVINLGFCF